MSAWRHLLLRVRKEEAVGQDGERRKQASRSQTLSRQIDDATEGLGAQLGQLLRNLLLSTRHAAEEHETLQVRQDA